MRENWEEKYEGQMMYLRGREMMDLRDKRGEEFKGWVYGLRIKRGEEFEEETCEKLDKEIFYYLNKKILKEE